MQQLMKQYEYLRSVEQLRHISHEQRMKRLQRDSPQNEKGSVSINEINSKYDALAQLQYQLETIAEESRQLPGMNRSLLENG